MTTITVERGKHAQERKDEELWVVTCDDRDVARRLSSMIARDKKFQRVVALPAHSVSFAAAKKRRKRYKKVLENLASAANMGKEVEMVYE